MDVSSRCRTYSSTKRPRLAAVTGSSPPPGARSSATTPSPNGPSRSTCAAAPRCWSESSLLHEAGGPAPPGAAPAGPPRRAMLAPAPRGARRAPPQDRVGLRTVCIFAAGGGGRCQAPGARLEDEAQVGDRGRGQRQHLHQAALHLRLHARQVGQADRRAHKLLPERRGQRHIERVAVVHRQREHGAHELELGAHVNVGRARPVRAAAAIHADKHAVAGVEELAEDELEELLHQGYG